MPINVALQMSLPHPDLPRLSRLLVHVSCTLYFFPLLEIGFLINYIHYITCLIHCLSVHCSQLLTQLTHSFSGLGADFYHPLQLLTFPLDYVSQVCPMHLAGQFLSFSSLPWSTHCCSLSLFGNVSLTILTYI